MNSSCQQHCPSADAFIYNSRYRANSYWSTDKNSPQLWRSLGLFNGVCVRVISDLCFKLRGCEHWHVYEKKETRELALNLWLPPALSPSGALNSETKARTKHACMLCLFKTRICNHARHTRSICMHRSLLAFAHWQCFIMKLCVSIFCWWAKNEASAESVCRGSANICG